MPMSIGGSEAKYSKHRPTLVSSQSIKLLFLKDF
jgi:hypothetical protein